MCKRQEQGLEFVKPGVILLPSEKTRLRSVVGSALVVTVYDPSKMIGGMASYCLPSKEKNRVPDSLIAKHAIEMLLDMLRSKGSFSRNLEAQIYGAAISGEPCENKDLLRQKNIKIGLETLKENGVDVVGIDVGGCRGRKIVFDTQTGETLSYKVNKIRKEDWLPLLSITKRPNC